MMHIVDARGLTCPQPVIEAKKALSSHGAPLIVWVDDEIARQNVEKMAVQLGLAPASDHLEDGSCRIIIQPVAETVLDAVLSGGGAMNPPTPASPAFPQQEAMPFPMEDGLPFFPQPELPKTEKPTIVVLPAAVMGTGDEVLGAALMKGFLYALTETEPAPDKVILYNGGVKLAVRGTDTAGDLLRLQQAGTEILVCGACVQHYGLADALAVGEITNMYAITQELMQAGKVVRP